MTLLETLMAAWLSALLVYLVAMSWSGFTRGAALISARAELVREGDLAIARLADDLRALEAWEAGPSSLCAWHLAGHELKLTGVLSGDGSQNNVCYYVEDDRLMRRVDLPRDQDTGESPPAEMVARFVAGLQVEALDPTPDVDPAPSRGLHDIQITLTIPEVGGRRLLENRRTSEPLERRRHLLVVLP